MTPQETNKSRPPKTESLETKTLRLLRYFHLRPRKGLGQHFLIDQEILDKVVSSAELTPSDIVLEVGPGLGVLTQELVKRVGWVFSIELDDKLAEILERTLASFNNITIVNENVLDIDPKTLLQEYQDKLPSELQDKTNYKVVANLPYYITSFVIRHFLEASVKPQSLVLMVQKEVAQEIAAKPGKLSILGISVQLYGEPTIVSYVPASSFYPAPEVNSAILKVVPYAKPIVEIADVETFFSLIHAGFSSSRKQLGNSLSRALGVPKAEIMGSLAKGNIDPQRRAETLTLDEWARLEKIFREAGALLC